MESGASLLKYGEPAPLKLGPKIFLSHSGKDKNFVRFLHKELCKQYYKHDDKITFFDEESLPTAEPISMSNIIGEAEGSELGVLVLTEDFFVNTPNPMRELEALVTCQVRLLPLFFTLSVDEVKDPIRRARWEEHWRKWPEVDEGVINVWRDALKHVITFSGLEYCKTATNQSDYIDNIVNEVIHILPPAYLFSEKGVAGMRRMCQIVNDMYKECASKTSTDGYGYTLDVVGIYGFAGLGKTTLCNGLCDFYLSQFKGKVCHIDLGSKPSKQTSSETHSEQAYFERMKHMLSNLTDYNDPIYFPQFSQLQNMLSMKISSRVEPVFLAIDNILPNKESQCEAKFYLHLEFPKGSKICITSRSHDILENLTSWCNSKFSVVIRHIPELEFEEARDILVHDIPLKMCSFRSTNVEDEVEACVNTCIIYEEQFGYYHPLMLKSLVAFLTHDRMQNIESNLKKIRSEGVSYKNDNVWESIFKVLDKSYQILSEEAKRMFLDLTLFYIIAWPKYKIITWIQSVYSEFDSNKLCKLISDLENFTFIRLFQRPWSIQIHDVLVEFGKYKVSKEGFFNPRYGVVENDTQWRNGRLPRTARSVTIARCHFDNSTPQLDLRNVEGVELLHLIDNAGLQEVLWSPTTRANLRSLIVMVPPGFSLCMVDHSSTSSPPTHIAGGCPKYIELQGNVLSRRTCLASVLPSFQSFLRNLLRLQITEVPLGLDLASLGALQNLEALALSDLPAQSFVNVKGCAKLKSLLLDYMPSMTSIQGLDELANLREMNIFYCGKLQALILPADGNFGLCVRHCDSLKEITLCTEQLSRPAADCTTTGSDDEDVQPGLYLSDCPTLTNIVGISEYSGSLSHTFYDSKPDPKFNLKEIFQALLDLADVDSSLCKARVTHFEHSSGAHGLELAGVKGIELLDAQHIRLLVSALFKAQACLRYLSIQCKKGVDCGCDQNPPQFQEFQGLEYNSDELHYSSLSYSCSQVRDLSSLSQWNLVRELSLRGCTSVELWPEFATMTSLRRLDLSYTSFKEWPAGLQLLLPSLRVVHVRGCTQLSAEELTKVITHIMPSRTVDEIGPLNHIIYDLWADLSAGRRDSCSIVAALNSHLPQLVALFYDLIWHAPEEYGARYFHPQHVRAIEVMYDLWCEEAGYGSQRRSFARRCGSRLLHSLNEIYARTQEAGREWYVSRTEFGNRSELLDRIGWYDAPKNDRTIKFLKSFVETPSFTSSRPLHSYYNLVNTIGEMTDSERQANISIQRIVKKSVVKAVWRMLGVPGVAAALWEHQRASASNGYFMQWVTLITGYITMMTMMMIIMMTMRARVPNVAVALREDFMQHMEKHLHLMLLMLTSLHAMGYYDDDAIAIGYYDDIGDDPMGYYDDDDDE